MIDGVEIRPLKQILDERGKVMKMLSVNDPHFDKFGEIYFSTVYPGVVKGWHMHKEMTLNYAVVSGTIKLVLYDGRESSPTRGEVQEIFTGEHDYKLISIPPLVVNGFKGVGPDVAIVANCCDIPHRPDEIVRYDPHTNDIPYEWALKER